MSLRVQPIDLNIAGWETTIFEQNNVAAGILALDEVLESPIEALTTSDITGDGAFNLLMQAVELHLEEEYDAQRITGKDYAMVYMNAVNVVSEVAVKFLANAQQAYRLNAEIGLLRQKLVTELSFTDDNLPYGLGFNFAPVERRTINPVDMCLTPPCPGPNLLAGISGYDNDGKYVAWVIYFDRDIADIPSAVVAADVDAMFSGFTLTGSISGELSFWWSMGTQGSPWEADAGNREVIFYTHDFWNDEANMPVHGETFTLTYDGSQPDVWKAADGDQCPLEAFTAELTKNIIPESGIVSVEVTASGYEWVVELQQYPAAFDLHYGDNTANGFIGKINGVPTTFPTYTYSYGDPYKFRLTSADQVQAGDVVTIDWDTTLGAIRHGVDYTVSYFLMPSQTDFPVTNNSGA